ncbi:hypothetical protein, partial [Salmonella sp. SAL4450]|uniref:hypothetical protein n=1 Tax=Salmonella sp. SAL4450 TaxID=3159905 RepID=UPI003978F8DE
YPNSPPSAGNYPPPSYRQPSPDPPIQGSAMPYADPYAPDEPPPQQQQQQQVQHLSQLPYINDAEYKQRLNKEQADRYALQVINEERAN